MVELQNRLSEESKKADKMEFEYKRVKEKVDSLQKEKDVCTIHCINICTCTVLFHSIILTLKLNITFSEISHHTFSRSYFIDGMYKNQSGVPTFINETFCSPSKKKVMHNF